MKILNTTHKRKAAVITAILLILLLFGVFNFGMKYLDPPIEYGIAINLGNSDVGSGEPVEKTQKTEQTKEEAIEESQEENTEEPTEEKQEEEAEETTQEKVTTNDTAKETPTIKETKKEKPKKTPKTTPKKTKTKKTKKEKPKPKPSKATEDALKNLLNGNSSSGSTKGEGDDKKAGVKGKQNGDPNATKYYGNGGKGSGGNYNLANRKAVSKPVKKPNCEEEGTVVVSIFVNQNGKVVKAIPGARGTTNSAPCLFRAAKEAAMATKWNEDGFAPKQQKGTIIYKFSLSK